MRRPSVIDPWRTLLLRFTAPVSLAIALLCATPAAAGLVPKLYGGQTKHGAATTARSADGSCSTVQAATDVVLRCDSGTGSARAKYLFALPNKAGSVMAQVNFDGLHRGATVTTKRVSDTLFRVTVTQGSQGRAEIQSVMIEYYYSA
jgi:hypothetical protein